MCPHVFHENLREDITEIRRKGQITAFVELFLSEAWPLCINLSALNGATGEE